MVSGVIVKALSGFYYVQTGSGLVECKARGRFRLDGTSPLVGDKVRCLLDADGRGRIEGVEPRRNWFVRPAVANIDALVFVAAGSNPITDPYLVDRVSVIAAESDCELIVCVNKCDLARAEELHAVFHAAGFPTLFTSAETGEGISELMSLLRGKISAFTGNSGVGKSSILNRILPEAGIETGEVSEKLGRGRHTTRHVELYQIEPGTYIADTPGFASFDLEMMKSIEKERLAEDFIDFRPFLGSCRFHDCAHLREPGCAVTEAVRRGEIGASRYRSYTRLYDLCAQQKAWEQKTKN